MARWSPWGPTRKYKVKLKSMRLHGFGFPEPHLLQEKEDSNTYSNKVMAVEVKWKGPTKKKTFPTIKFQHLRNVSGDAAVPRNGDPLVVWEEQEFDYTCNLSILPTSSKDAKISYGPWGVSFHLLLGEESKKKKKMRDIGKGTLDLGELLTVSGLEDGEIRHSVPITYQFDGQPPRQSTLSIVVSFIEMKVSHTRASSCDSAELIPSSDELSKPRDSLMMRAKSFGLSHGKKKRTNKSSQAAAHDSSTSEESDSAAWSEMGAASSSVTQLDVPEDKNFGFWIWKRRGNTASFKRAKTTDPLHSQLKEDESGASTSDEGSWEVKELESRDGRAKLKAKVFFATYDQRSEKASGESACTAIVAMFAHWLQANPTLMPTRAVFDQLIAEGSSEWRRLCQDESRRAEFPDSHLDLDTVLQAELRPLTVLRERSHVGFFSPEKFDYLKEAKSLDDIWKEMIENSLPGVYIVSWNDHFFVLKVGPEACYIVDSLGERLYEGCDRAYILEFDDSSVMYRKVGKDGESVDPENKGGDEESEGEVICKGKECCREYMKRFLAAITVRELEEAEEKGTACIFKLHERLQIEFHYSSSSEPSACTSRTDSPIIDR